MILLIFVMIPVISLIFVRISLISPSPSRSALISPFALISFSTLIYSFLQSISPSPLI
jgi:hypothetical protein